MTSPPYDALRTYRGVRKFNPHQVAAELLRVTVPGGVVVWIVNDQVIDGSESCSSFRQALAFRDCGWRLHDTMIYQRISPFPDSVRYHASFEYMFIFAHGSPRVFNRIADRRNGMPGKRIKGTERQADGTLKPFDRGAIRQEFGSRTNVWQCATGFRKTAPDAEVHEHPAAMPLRLAADHVRSWSNPGDTVLDCFSGSGQTAIAAELLDRRWIMIDVAEDYLGLAARRLAGMRANRQKFLDFCA